MYNLTYHNLAEEEIITSLSWYEEQSLQAFQKFADNLVSALVSISENPATHPYIYDEFRKKRISKFPYKVIYRIQENEVYIIAIAHDKRNPDYWKSRI